MHAYWHRCCRKHGIAVPRCHAASHCSTPRVVFWVRTCHSLAYGILSIDCRHEWPCNNRTTRHATVVRRWWCWSLTGPKGCFERQSCLSPPWVSQPLVKTSCFSWCPWLLYFLKIMRRQRQFLPSLEREESGASVSNVIYVSFPKLWPQPFNSRISMLPQTHTRLSHVNLSRSLSPCLSACPCLSISLALCTFSLCLSVCLSFSPPLISISPPSRDGG